MSSHRRHIYRNRTFKACREEMEHQENKSFTDQEVLNSFTEIYTDTRDPDYGNKIKQIVEQHLGHVLHNDEMDDFENLLTLIKTYVEKQQEFRANFKRVALTVTAVLCHVVGNYGKKFVASNSKWNIVFSVLKNVPSFLVGYFPDQSNDEAPDQEQN